MASSKNYDSIMSNGGTKRGLRRSIAKTSTNGFLMKSGTRQGLSPSPDSKGKRNSISP